MLKGFLVSRNLGINISRDRKINIEKKNSYFLYLLFQYFNSYLLFEYFKIASYISKFFNIFIKILL